MANERDARHLEQSLEETALELRRISERARIIIEALPSGIIIVDRAGMITQCNRETERLFGYTRNELIGQIVERLVPERLRSRHGAYRDEFFSAPQTRAMGAGRDLYGLRKDGSEFPIEIGLNPMRTDEGDFVLAAIVDISERKAAEERFRTVVESAPSALVIVNAKGQMILVNSQAEQMFRYGREDMIGKEVEMLVPERFRASHPHYRDTFFEDPKARPMGAGRDLYGLRRDGTEIPVEIGLKPMMIDGQPHVLAAIVDITERKHIEAALLQKNQEMEQFIYTVSHDLKGPIVTSMSFIQFLREDLPPDSSPDVFDSLTRLENANRRMAQLIDDLLRLSRIGRLELKPEIIDVGELIHDLCQDLEERHKDNHFDVDVATAMPAIIADRSRIMQLFENLLSNAIKYGRTNDAVHIQVGAEIHGHETWFYVKDEGRGIAPEYHDKIFGLFERLDAEKEGAGVGLAIVRRVAQLHGGRVWVESTLDQGATFWFAIPQSSDSGVTGES